MSYHLEAFIAVVIFAFVHLFAKQTRNLDEITHGRFLSMCGGVAIAYVFIDILPKLSKGDLIIKKALSEVFPYIEHHVYVMALAGFLLFFTINRAHSILKNESRFYFSLFSYSVFNFLVAYAVVDPNNPETKPLILFTFAMALHYFTNDYTLEKDHGDYYGNLARAVLILSLFLGWMTGFLFVLSEAAVAGVSAFIAGGVILNVTRHELPKENLHSLGAFLMAAIFYTIILLMI